MSFHRFRPVVVAGAATLSLVAVGCSDDPSVSAPDATSTTVAGSGGGSSTTSGSTTTEVGPGVTTTVVAPPVTKPLTTAPPSALLDEVTAAYDAAYADLLAAEAVMDENHERLDDHIAGVQLEQWRTVIRGLRADGLTVRDIPNAPEWRRVEAFEARSELAVVLEVCRMQRQETVDRSGLGSGPDERAYRYLETLEKIGGVWKWTGREWVDGAVAGSDCAQQQP